MLPSGLLPAIGRDLAVSESAVGLLVGAWAITIAVVSIPLVRLTVRVSRARLLAGALAVTALANLATALAPNYQFALTGRIIAAAAHGLFWAVVVAYIPSVVDPARVGRATAVVLSGPTIAGLVGLPLAALVADDVGWRPVFAGASGALLLTAGAIRLTLPRRIEVTGDAPPSGRWDISARAVMLVAVGGGLVLVGHFAAFTYVTTLVSELAGSETGLIPVVLLVLGATGCVGVAASGYAADRFPRAALAVVAASLAGGLGLVRLGEGRPIVFGIGVIVWGLAIGGFPAVLQTRVMRVSSRDFRPVAGSVIVTVLNLGIAGGAMLGSAIIGRGPLALILSAVAAAVVGTLIPSFSAGPRFADHASSFSR